MSTPLTTADKKFQGLFGKAIRQYRMIDDGDRLAVAVSGGKDSITLLYLLKERLKWVPIKYELLAIHLDMGFADSQPGRLEQFCRDIDVPFYFEQTDYGIKAHGPENRENPCFLCSWLRRKRLFALTKDLNFPKLVLGHNKDDIIETLFLNLSFKGVLSTMQPRQTLFNGRLTLIRPLALLEERQITDFVERRGLPVIPNSCPSAGNSARKEIRGFLETLYAKNRKIKGNIFHALSHARPEYLLPPIR